MAILIGKYKCPEGKVNIQEFSQMIYESLEFFDKHSITHILAAELKFKIGNERGEEVRVYDRNGELVTGFKQDGPYRCAADFYGAQSLGPQTTTEPGAACAAQTRSTHAASPSIPA